MPCIVLEGLDGSGKSLQAARLADRLTAEGLPVLRLREPGGTRLGEALRATVLDPATEACPMAEMFVFQAARAQLCATVIAPALAEGRWVVLDRFWHSTIAYQCGGLGLPADGVRAAIGLATAGITIDAPLCICVDPGEAKARREAARGPDRIERRGPDYQRAVATAYGRMVAQGDLVPIDGAGDVDAVAHRVWTAVQSLVGPNAAEARQHLIDAAKPWVAGRFPAEAASNSSGT